MVKLVPISLLSTVFSSPPLVSEGCFLQIYINNLIMHTFTYFSLSDYMIRKLITLNSNEIYKPVYKEALNIEVHI